LKVSGRISTKSPMGIFPSLTRRCRFPRRNEAWRSSLSDAPVGRLARGLRSAGPLPAGRRPFFLPCRLPAVGGAQCCAEGVHFPPRGGGTPWTEVFEKSRINRSQVRVQFSRCNFLGRTIDNESRYPPRYPQGLPRGIPETLQTSYEDQE
jgi:hypothetical protein